MSPLETIDYSMDMSSFFDMSAFTSDNDTNNYEFDIPRGKRKKYETPSEQLPNLISLQSNVFLNEWSKINEDEYELESFESKRTMSPKDHQRLMKTLELNLESTLREIEPTMEPIKMKKCVMPESSKTSTTLISEALSTSNNGTSNYLHRACQMFSNSIDIIQSALVNDPAAVRRYEKVDKLKSQSSSSSVKRGLLQSNSIPISATNKRQRLAKEPYQLPVNIALKHKASQNVVELLVDAGTDVLELQDGSDGSNSLSIALKFKPNDIAIVDVLLVANPKCAMGVDRRQNYPLHIACARGSSLDVIRHLYLINPDALSKKNFNGETPLDIAQRSTTMCNDDVIDFLQQCASETNIEV